MVVLDFDRLVQLDISATQLVDRLEKFQAKGLLVVLYEESSRAHDASGWISAEARKKFDEFSR